ncbi:unnamed protein product, partial [Mesorhabditis spiculigera]
MLPILRLILVLPSLFDRWSTEEASLCSLHSCGIYPCTQLTYPPSAERTNQGKAANPPAKVPEAPKASPPRHFPSILLVSSLVVLLIFP